MPRRMNGRPTIARVLGLFLAVFGLVGQLSFGAVAQRADDQRTVLAALANAAVDCDPAPPAPDRGGTPHRHHRAEPSLCPVRSLLDQPSFTIVPAADAPDDRAAAPVRRALPPPARGPPPPTARVGEPRAPPIPA